MSNYQNNQTQNNQQLREILWNLTTMTVYAAPIDGSKRKPSFKLDYRKNRVRIVVRTGVENDKDYGRMTVDVPPPVFQDVIQLVEKSAAFKITPENPEFKAVIEIYRPDFNNKGSGNRVRAGEIIIGKDKAGMVYISLHMNNRPCPKFEWGSPNDWVRYRHSSGEYFKPNELSVLQALSWARLMTNTLPIIMNRFYEPEVFGNNNNNNGGGGGNYNNRQNNNGGGNSSNSDGGDNNRHGGYNDVPSVLDGDEDLPF